jgi:hypothetical protein
MACKAPKQGRDIVSLCQQLRGAKGQKNNNQGVRVGLRNFNKTYAKAGCFCDRLQSFYRLPDLRDPQAREIRFLSIHVVLFATQSHRRVPD